MDSEHCAAQMSILTISRGKSDNLCAGPQRKVFHRGEVFHTQGILTYVLSGAYEKEPSFQRKAEHLREQGQDVESGARAMSSQGRNRRV